MKPETAKNRAQKSRINNIAYMGVRYSAMTSVFRKDSKESIVHKVEAAYRRLEDMENEEEYRRVHRRTVRVLLVITEVKAKSLLGKDGNVITAPTEDVDVVH